MKASNKTILFTVTGSGATVKRTPVAVCGDENRCRPLAVAVMTAYKAGDIKAVKNLGMEHLVTAEGTLAEGLRFNRITVAYEPEIDLADFDPFADESKPTT
jgi:hypothetical protein